MSNKNQNQDPKEIIANAPSEIFSDREKEAFLTLMQEEKDPNKWPLPVDRIFLYEYLQTRCNSPHNVPLEDMYLVCCCKPTDTGAYEEFDIKFTLLGDARFPDTPAGDLRVFFLRPDSPWWNQFPSGNMRPKLVDQRRIAYPSISQVKMRKP